MKKMNKKGFTLIEMLVVIAIIAILVSIVIPVVGDSTAKAKASKDAANIRAAITEVTAKGVAEGVNTEKTVKLTCGGTWTGVTEVAGIPKASLPTGDEVKITYNYSTGVVKVGSVEVTGSSVTASANPS